MNRKIILILFLPFFLTACFNSSKIQPAAKEDVPKNIVDISEKNRQEVNVLVGDVLYIKLFGNDYKNYQWSFSSFESIDYLNLVKHEISVLDQEDGSYIDEWEIEVIKEGSFSLKFDYGKLNKDPESFFEVEVVSQKISN